MRSRIGSSRGGAERGQAQATYAKASGKAPQRPDGDGTDNVFTVKVGNLPPGETVSIDMAYAHRMEVSLAENTFSFPLVVAHATSQVRICLAVPVGDGTASDIESGAGRGPPDSTRLPYPVCIPAQPVPQSRRRGGRAPAGTARLQPARHVPDRADGTGNRAQSPG